MLRFGLIVAAIRLGVALVRKLKHSQEPDAPPCQGPVTDDELQQLYLAAAADVPDAPDWRNSIVDRLKILRQESSKLARAELWFEMGHRDNYEGSAEQNIQLLADVDERLRNRVPLVP